MEKANKYIKIALSFICCLEKTFASLQIVFFGCHLNVTVENFHLDMPAQNSLKQSMYKRIKIEKLKKRFEKTFNSQALKIDHQIE